MLSGFGMKAGSVSSSRSQSSFENKAMDFTSVETAQDISQMNTFFPPSHFVRLQ